MENHHFFTEVAQLPLLKIKYHGKVWGMMKDKVVANYCYPTLAALHQAVQLHLDNISPSIALRTIGLNV